MNKLAQDLKQLKERRKAVILAHNYQPDEVQEIADFVGDSLELSRRAAQTDSEVIVFCGVHFMAETAKMLSPQKIVLLPDAAAGCPLADSIEEAELKELKTRHPGARVVAYVNSSAEIKALSDICCTSVNALEVVNSLKKQEVIFVPDQNLGRYVEQKLGRELILSKGYCIVHHRLAQEEIKAAQELHPQALFLAHPECRMEILALADFVGSTSQMLKYVKESTGRQFLIGTERGILWRMKKENPEKKFFLASGQLLCQNMKKTNLEKIKRSLETLTPRIEVEPKIQSQALRAISAMLEFHGSAR